MAVTKRVDINKGLPGATGNNAATSTSGLIAGGVAVANKLVLGTVYVLTNPAALADLGLNSNYDNANACLTFYHASEFFRTATDGVVLYLMVVPMAILPGAILDDAGNIYARYMVLQAGRNMRQLAIAFSPTADYVETLVDGFNGDVRAAIPKAQAFHDWAYDNDAPLQIILEGRKYSGNATSAINLRAIPVGSDVLEADKVSICIGQDWAFADTLSTINKYHAAVGTLLGCVALVEIEQSCGAGDVVGLNLTSVTKSKFVTPGLSNHTTHDASYNQLDTLDDKGYIFPFKTASATGCRWNNDHVCAPVLIDDDGVMNESTIAYGRVMNEAVRELKTVFTPKVNTTYPVDATTGKLSPGALKFFEGLGNQVFDDMRTDGHISGGDTIVDPNSDLWHPPKQLTLSFALVPLATVNKFKATLFLKTNF